MGGFRTLGISIFAAAAFCAQPDVCDADLLRLVNPRNPLRYGPRPGRCEGVYDPERAGGAALLLVSYIDNFAPFNAEADKALQVRWLAPGHSPVRIRAYALKARTYYQLDANSGLATEFSWPLEIVRQISLDRRQLGVVGWTPVATRSKR
jgi:hypothetical protein